MYSCYSSIPSLDQLPLICGKRLTKVAKRNTDSGVISHPCSIHNPPPPIARGRLASGDGHQAMLLNHGISIRECVNIFEYVGIATAVVKPVLDVVVAPNADYLADWTRSGPGPVDRSHHRANRNGSGSVPLRSHREVVGSFRNDWTQ